MAFLDDQFIEKLNTLERKIHRILVKCNTLQKEHDRLVEENIALKEQAKKQQSLIENLKNQEKFANIVSAITNGTTDDVDGMRKKLDEYIDEVNRCIEHLNK